MSEDDDNDAADGNDDIIYLHAQEEMAFDIARSSSDSPCETAGKPRGKNSRGKWLRLAK